jgi:hypothetical protein
MGGGGWGRRVVFSVVVLLLYEMFLEMLLTLLGKVFLYLSHSALLLNSFRTLWIDALIK